MTTKLVAVAALLALSTALQAQTSVAPTKSGKPWTIGVIGTAFVAGFVWQRLRELGYAEGQNYVVVHFELGPDVQARLAAFANQPDAAADVFIAMTNPAVRAATKVAPSTPVVAWVHDGLKSGLVTSMARPGGNITGLDSRAPETVEKRVALITALLPRARRLGVLYGVVDDSGSLHLEALRQAAAPRGLTIVPLPVRAVDDTAQVLQAASGSGLDAVMLVTDFVTSAFLPQILKELRARNLPSVGEFKVMVTNLGCSLSYGSTFDEFGAVAARQVDRILRGAKPGDIPMEFPTRFEFVLGVKQLNELGIKVSPELRLRADEVVE